MQILHSPIYEVPGRELFLCQTNIKCMYAIDALVKKTNSLHTLWENKLNGKNANHSASSDYFVEW